MVLLNCAVIGEGSVVSIVIDAGLTVALLKKAIAEELKYTGRADKLQLFLAKPEGGDWLPDDDTVEAMLRSGTVDTSYTKMRASWKLNKPSLFGPNVSLGEDVIHVLVDPTIQVEFQRGAPGEKRQRTEAIDPLKLKDLKDLVAIAQQLSAANVGTLLKTPETIFGTSTLNGLYIRQEYRDLQNIIMPRLALDRSIRRILVVGSPGIGKSVFGVFLLLLFMTEKKNIAYRPLGDSLIYFTWNSTIGYEVSDTPRAERTYDGLFDGNEADGALRFDRFNHAFLFASPRTVNYNEFVKEVCFKVYMNPWTKDECQKFADAIHLKDQDEWLRRFNLVGGKPRFVFSSLQTFDELVQRVKEAIPQSVDKLKEEVLRFEQKVFEKHMKHIVFNLYRNENAPSSSYLAYSSSAVEAIVGARYKIQSTDEIRSLLQTSAPNLQSWRGKEIEKFLLQDLAISTFSMKSLKERTAGTDTHHDPYNAKSAIIQAPSEIQDKLLLHIPLSKSFPAIDGVLVVPETSRVIYAQSTVGTTHPIKYEHLKKVYQHLMQRQEFQGYEHILLFIVSNDIYDGFTVQAYKNADGKNCTARIDINVTQYVGKIIRQ